MANFSAYSAGPLILTDQHWINQGGAVFVTEVGEAAFNGNILFQDNYAVRRQGVLSAVSTNKCHYETP